MNEQQLNIRYYEELAEQQRREIESLKAKLTLYFGCIDMYKNAIICPYCDFIEDKDLISIKQKECISCGQSFYLGIKQQFLGEKKVEEDRYIFRDAFDMKIENLNIEPRTYNALKHSGVNVLGDIIGKNETDLLRIRNIGRGALENLKIALKPYGYTIPKDHEIFKN